MTCMKQEFCIHEKYCQRHIGQNFDSCILFSRNSKPMTNEEWIKSANTEQLAKVLLSFCQYPCEICKIECDDGNACTYNKALNTIVEWLKQPHTPKE